jgi:hypothetical protein
MANELKCSIEFEDEWIPSSDGCHWNHDRIFYLTYKILDNSNITPNAFYYRVGGSYSANIQSYTRIAFDDESLFNPSYNTWIYELRLSKINIKKGFRLNDGWITVTAYAQATDNDSSYQYTAENSFEYYLELPPQQIENLKTDLVISRPGELKCSWTKPTVLNEYIDEVNGYVIEVFRKPEKSDDWLPVSGLAWDPTELAKGNYKLTMVPEDPIEIKVPEALPDEEEIITFNSSHLISREIRIDDPNKTEFFFVPKALEINAGDNYEIVIYPYSHYLDEDGDGTEALISPQPTKYRKGTSKGVVRVKTTGGWVEGQVWVYAQTADGLKWVQAEAVYAMADDGTGKGVWKEAQ